MKQRLAEVRQRLERLHREPRRDPAGFEHILVPVLKVLGWRPELETEAARALLDEARERLSAPLASEPAALDARLVQAALEELEANAAVVERAALVHRLPPSHYVGWLTRVHAWLEGVHLAGSTSNHDVLRMAAGPARSSLHPPLTSDTGDVEDAVLGMGAVDALLAAARDEVGTLDRRRRLLEGARRVLLELGASAMLSEGAIEARRADITTGITELNRLQAAGVDPTVRVDYQLRRARTRRDARGAYLALKTLDVFARQRGDVALAQRTARCIEHLERGAPSYERGAVTGDPGLHSALPESVREALHASYRDGRDEAIRALATATMSDTSELRRRAAHLSEQGALATALMGLVADGCFDIGGSVSPVRVSEDLRTRLEVRHPTATLTLARATGPSDLGSAVIDDPRLLLYELATGRLLCRRYLDERVERRSRTGLLAQVRIYVLDGSSSMVGARARMRDALLVSELGALVGRLTAREAYVHSVLYFRYFDHEARPTRRVATVDDALAAVREAVSSRRGGRTNIEGALIDSFAQVEAARERDPALTHAQIVLVTDGEADVSAESVLRARAAITEIPVGVSVIALGDENRDLRALADQQRRAGEAVFYHHISDAELSRWESGDVDLGVPLRLDASVADPTWLDALHDELDATEAAARGEASSTDQLESAGAMLSALDEVGLSAEGHLADGERARSEALLRDRAALERRFARWFPALEEHVVSLWPTETHPDRIALVSLVNLLSVVVEVMDLLGSRGLPAMVDAIELTGRLLLDGGISPARYKELLAGYPALLRPGVNAIRVRSAP